MTNLSIKYFEKNMHPNYMGAKACKLHVGLNVV